MQACVSGNPESQQAAGEGVVHELVLDTNVILDLWLFARPSVEALRVALGAGRARWLSTPTMLAELAHVRQRPHSVRFQPAAALHNPPASLVAEPSLAAPWRCADRSDQVFLNLAWQQKVPLWTRDRHLLSMRSKARRAGLVIETPEEGQLRLWPSPL